MQDFLQDVRHLGHSRSTRDERARGVDSERTKKVR